MKQIIVTVALIILGVFMANNLILGDTEDVTSMKSGAKIIANKMISEINSID